MRHRKHKEAERIVRSNPFLENLERITTSVGTLDSLSIDQLITAWLYFENISKKENDHQIGQFIDVDEWFFALNTTQRDQVIAYGRSVNVGEQIIMIANWDGFKGQRQFRLETPIHSPAISR